MGFLILTRDLQLPSGKKLQDAFHQRGEKLSSFNPFAQETGHLFRSTPRGVLIRTTGILFDDGDLALAQSWKNRGAIALNSPESLLAIRSKDWQFSILEREKLPLLPWCPWKGQINERFFSQLTKYWKCQKLVVKTVRGCKGLGQYLIQDSNELVKLWNNFYQKNDQRYLIQAYLPAQKEIRLAFIGGQIWLMKKEGTHWQKNASNAQWSALNEQEKKTLPFSPQEVLEKVGHQFPLDYGAIDILISEQGEWFLLEVNGVPGFEQWDQVFQMDIAGVLADYFLTKFYRGFR
jgi:glutathione synthase/RimK-type ligase-like ATP-grasp enzyme